MLGNDIVLVLVLPILSLIKSKLCSQFRNVHRQLEHSIYQSLQLIACNLSDPQNIKENMTSRRKVLFGMLRSYILLNDRQERFLKIPCQEAPSTDFESALKLGHMDTISGTL